MIIAGTGHRPNKLGGYSNSVSAELFRLALKGLSSYKDDYQIEKVISGGALGWDQAVANAAFALSLPVTMALPFKGFEGKWPPQSQEALQRICDMATEVVYVEEPGYAPWKMQSRNEWMVDRARVVLALWNGTPGGTANCIKYARSKLKSICNMWYAQQGLA